MCLLCWPREWSDVGDLREIAALTDALGTHACECGHLEMRLLPTERATARPAALRYYRCSFGRAKVRGRQRSKGFGSGA